MLIGPDLPHLTFSYGQPVGTPFEEIVVQLRGDFLGPDFWEKPEMTAIRQLLARSHEGLSFGGSTRTAVGPALRQLLSAPPFMRLLLLLQVLQELAQAPGTDCQPLHAGTGGQGLSGKEQQRLSRVYQFVEQHYQRASLSVQEVADVAYLSVPAFCRYFKKMTRHTLTDFLQEYRVGPGLPPAARRRFGRDRSLLRLRIQQPLALQQNLPQVHRPKPHRIPPPAHGEIGFFG